ncbi:hypothetical protein FOA52_015430 [Chlamydomonas sp. UWO 241]|nr:hypothetical protein FOA52_015430 [Chlamydomonas sp. UWO 241]
MVVPVHSSPGLCGMVVPASVRCASGYNHPATGMRLVPLARPAELSNMPSTWHGRLVLELWQPPPSGCELGQPTSVAAAADGTLWLLYRRVWFDDAFRADHVIQYAEAIPWDVVLRVDPSTGEVVSSWGRGVFSMPHMLSLDHEGNVWVADAGLHQVLKFTPSGQLLMSVGTPRVPSSLGGGLGSGSADGSASSTYLCKPTRAAPARDGTFVVADGLCASRLVRFSADGKTLLAEVPLPASGGAVHYVVLDECVGLAYVLLREGSFLSVHNATTLAHVRDVALGSVTGLGRAWALVVEPTGGRLTALLWDWGKSPWLVDVADTSWRVEVPGHDAQHMLPHDVALGVARAWQPSGTHAAAPAAAPATAAADGGGGGGGGKGGGEVVEVRHVLYVVPIGMPPVCGALRRLLLAPVAVPGQGRQRQGQGQEERRQGEGQLQAPVGAQGQAQQALGQGQHQEGQQAEVAAGLTSQLLRERAALQQQSPDAEEGQQAQAQSQEGQAQEGQAQQWQVVQGGLPRQHGQRSRHRRTAHPYGAGAGGRPRQRVPGAGQGTRGERRRERQKQGDADHVP